MRIPKLRVKKTQGDKMKISQGQNLAVGLYDKDEFGPSPDGTVSTIRELSNVPGLKNPFVFFPNGR
jgi:hypothetical protein